MEIGGSSSSNFLSINRTIETASERIASGRRINSAADDAAGFAISNRLGSQIDEFSQSIRNANDGISFLQTAGGAIDGLNNNINRIRELAIQASNGTLNNSDRQALNEEAQQLIEEVGRTVEGTSFNGQALFNNNANVGIQVGGEDGDSISVGIANLSEFLDQIEFNDIDLGTTQGSQSALGVLDSFSDNLNFASSEIGAQQNRLDSTINSLFSALENSEASRSRIEDADFAQEVSNLVTGDIQNRVSLAITVQANEDSRNVLRLLGL